MYDVIVIGASPSGLITARECSRNNLDVLILEKRISFEDQKLPDTSFYGFFDFLDLEVFDDYIRNEVKGMEIISPLGSSLRIKEKGFSIDRTKFSNFYLKQAKEMGAEIKFGAKVTDIERNEVRTGDGEKFKSRVVVFAGGSNSEVIDKLNMKTMKYPEDVANAIQAYMKNVGSSNEYFRYFMGREVAPGWKAAINPMGSNTYSVGVFVRDVSPDKYFEKFLDKPIFDEAELIKKDTGEDQIITIPNELVKGNILVVGGAAGQAGIPFSMKAGECCGEAISEAIDGEDIKKSELRRYEKNWLNKYNKYYKLARFSLRTIEKMSDEDLDKSIKALREEELSEVLNKHDSTYLQGFIIALKMFKNDPTIIKLLKYLL